VIRLGLRNPRKKERKKEKRRVLEKIPRQLEGSFLIFLTLGLTKQSNTVTAIIIGEMEMWRCPDYLFPVAKSRGDLCYICMYV